MSSDDGDDALITITNVIDSMGIEIYKELFYSVFLVNTYIMEYRRE